MKRSFWMIVVFLATAGGVCSAQSDAPSLADVARQKKPEKKAVIVLTDEDSTSVPASDVATAGDSAPALTASGDSTGSSAKEAGKQAGSAPAPSSKESSEVAELKNKLDSLKQQQDGWKRSSKRYQDLLANETDDFRRQMYQDALDNDQNNVARYREEIDRVEAQLAKAKQASSTASATK
jgi:spermidine/putrescine-binding protein